MPRTIDDAVREVCLSFPQAEEFMSHGAPNFRVRKGRTFATYAVNIHGDGRVALWINAPDGAQAQHVAREPKHFFVPPYVGTRGWLGVNLDQGMDWKRIARFVREAYVNTAPAKLTAGLGPAIAIAAPAAKLAPEKRDRLLAPNAKRVLEKLRRICLALPETGEAKQFGSPVWQAGKRTFACAYDYGEGLKLAFHVGVAQQSLYTADPRYTIPKYMGHNGWIALDASRGFDAKEVGSLALQSYRHFALKRMLAKLDAD